MVHFVLDDLCSPSGKGFDTGLELLVLPLNFDSLIALAGTGAAQQRKTALCCVILPGRLQDLRVEHGHISAFVIKGDDPLGDTDHI